MSETVQTPSGPRNNQYVATSRSPTNNMYSNFNSVKLSIGPKNKNGNGGQFIPTLNPSAIKTPMGVVMN